MIFSSKHRNFFLFFWFVLSVLLEIYIAIIDWERPFRLTAGILMPDSKHRTVMTIFFFMVLSVNLKYDSCKVIEASFSSFVFMFADIDECNNTQPVCSQMCFNTEGSFTCACRDGYTLTGSTMCVGTSGMTQDEGER